MMIRITALFCTFFCLNNISFAQTDSTIYKKVDQIVQDAKQQFAPDKRTKIVALTQANAINNQYVIESSVAEASNFIKSQTANIPATIRINALPDSTVGQKVHGVVNLSVANFRTKPGNASEMATQAILGTEVDLLQKVDGEYRARTPEGYISYVPASSIAAMDHAALEKWRKLPKLIYTAEFGKSLSQADPKSVRVSDLVYGNILGLLAEEGNYYKVTYPDNRIAFILKDEALTFDKWLGSRELTADNVISSAKTMMGLPYLWGGTSVKGVDCSGFTKTAYYMNGYIIPRDASQQVLAGQKIDILDKDGHFDAKKALKNLKPADLLFFASGKNSNPNARVTHVALYIGNGEFIHSAGTVRINSMLKDAANYDDFQTRTVVAAKRYIGVKDQQVQKIQENPYYNQK
ncbi:C40 family peptidase [Sphingobacterium sp.]|uniref:C40 family peptidase n=1 Tax=Sphingobacterium sp. TaxID=341027 RepID=UPI0028AC564A|nr:C40 family peptidase [Sphingobacterium sp.]